MPATRRFVVPATAARRLAGRRSRSRTLDAAVPFRHHVPRTLAVAVAIESRRRSADDLLDACSPLPYQSGPAHAVRAGGIRDQRRTALDRRNATPALLHRPFRADALTGARSRPDRTRHHRRRASFLLHALPALLHSTWRADALAGGARSRHHRWLAGGPLRAFPAYEHGPLRADALIRRTDHERRWAGMTLHAFPAIEQRARRTDALAGDGTRHHRG
jgi:hypothetical protein